MSLHVEALPRIWTDAGAKAYYEELERAIAEAYTLPPHLVGAYDPRPLIEFHSLTTRSIQWMIDEAARVLDRNSFPGGVIVRKEP